MKLITGDCALLLSYAGYAAAAVASRELLSRTAATAACIKNTIVRVTKRSAGPFPRTMPSSELGPNVAV